MKRKQFWLTLLRGSTVKMYVEITRYLVNYYVNKIRDNCILLQRRWNFKMFHAFVASAFLEIVQNFFRELPHVSLRI